MRSKADVDSLNAIHDRMSIYFTQLLDGGERLAPAELTAILKFLKDNEITADQVESKTMANLIKNFLDQEDAVMDELRGH